jgi:hypothetical protein
MTDSKFPQESDTKKLGRILESTTSKTEEPAHSKWAPIAGLIIVLVLSGLVLGLIWRLTN